MFFEDVIEEKGQSHVNAVGDVELEGINSFEQIIRVPSKRSPSP